MKAEDARPISAPPANAYERVQAGLPAEEDAEVDRQEPIRVLREHQETEKVAAAVPVPRYRSVMQVTNRFNWQHFYSVPANVGMNNVAWIVQAMQEEGCPLQDIQITFEVQEMKT